jgi:hypothetical protein
VLWSSLGNAAAALTLANANYATTFNQTSAVVWLWANTTVGTVGSTNASPLLELAANYWATGGVTGVDLWTIGTAAIVAGLNGRSNLTFIHTGSTGQAAVQVPLLDIGGTDAGISRLGAASLAIGNGTAGDTTGSLSLASVVATTGVQIGSGGLGSCSLVVDFSGATYNVLKFDNYTGDAVFGVGGATIKLATVWASGVTATWSSTATVHGNPDSGISRLGAASLAIGNGTAGDFTGTLKLGTINATTAYQANGTPGVTQTAIAVGTLATIEGIVTTFTGVSDERLKDATLYDGGLSEILAINPIRFTYNELGQKFGGWDKDHVYVGFSAQNVQKSIPEAIQGTEGVEQYLSFDDRPVIAALVNAVKELTARLVCLENKDKQ